MIIKIDDEWQIFVDERNYTLRRDLKKKDKRGNDQFKTIGYFKSIEHALDRLARYKTLEEEKVVTLNEHLTELKNNRQELIDAVRGVVE